MADLTAGPDRQERRESLEIEKLRVEVNKVIAETAKINREVGWYPFVVGGGVAVGLIGAGAAFGGVLVRALAGAG